MRIKHILLIFSSLFLLAFTTPARAEFLISSAIVEFTADGPRQHDIDLVSRSATSDYVVSEVNEIIHPGTPNEQRVPIEDPDQAGLLVTPDKTVLSPGTRKVLRFVLLRDPDEQEHIYRVVIKPVINGIDNTNKLGLKVLVGYEALVIVRPATITSSFTATRSGKTLHIVNNGNSNILLEHGSQCDTAEKCPTPSVLRVYAGQTTDSTLPLARAITYTVWNGQNNSQYHID